MRGFLAVVLFLGAAGGASAAGLRDLSKPKTLAAVDHGRWKSYTVHKESGLSVHLVHVGPGILRNVYHVTADSLGLALHRQRLMAAVKPAQKHMDFERGDLSYQSAGLVGGGWVAGRKGVGVDLLFITRSPELPRDLDPEAAKALGPEKRKTRGELHAFGEARAKAEAMKGALRRVPVVTGSGLNAELLRLGGGADIENPSSSSAVLFAVEGSVSVRQAGGGAGVGLRADRVYIVDPRAAVRLDSLGGGPAYLLMITPSGS